MADGPFRCRYNCYSQEGEQHPPEIMFDHEEALIKEASAQEIGKGLKRRITVR